MTVAAALQHSPRRILFFVGSMNAGGAERVAATLVNAWAARGDEVCLVMTHLASRESFYSLHSQVQCVSLADYLPARGRWLKPMAKARAIRAIYHEFQPDVVLSFLTNVNINVLYALKNIPTPIVVCERTHPLYSRSATRSLRLLRRWLYPRASRVVLQTTASAQDFARVQTHARSYAVVPNPIDPRLLQRRPAYENTLQMPPKLIALGRLAEVKRFDLLIEAFAALPSAYQTWELHLYGDGPQREALQQLAQQRGVDKRVFFQGRTDEPWQKLSESQLFVLCSAYEGFPNALLEAMALGLPCITLDCPSGPAEITEQGQVARLLPKNADVQTLTQALEQLMGDPKQRRDLGVAARESVVRRYALETVLTRWDELFTELESNK
ncbi:MAG TPA: glycosyltransferase family 4 protein [Paenalcaligenes sp.]|nr:glycosyltransferase family 4 protein [Paenalcaligenes sp.]